MYLHGHSAKSRVGTYTFLSLMLTYISLGKSNYFKYLRKTQVGIFLIISIENRHFTFFVHRLKIRVGHLPPNMLFCISIG